MVRGLKLNRRAVFGVLILWSAGWLATSLNLGTYFLRQDGAEVVYEHLLIYESGFQTLKHLTPEQSQSLKRGIRLSHETKLWLKQTKQLERLMAKAKSEGFALDLPSDEESSWLTLQCRRSFFFGAYESALKFPQSTTSIDQAKLWSPIGWLTMGFSSEFEGSGWFAPLIIDDLRRRSDRVELVR
jgi:hypothetical protein